LGRPAFYRGTLVFEVRNDVGYRGMRWTTVSPADKPGTSIVLEPPAADPGTTDDEAAPPSIVTIPGGQAAGTRSTQGGASMAERKPAKKATRQSAKRTTGKASKGFTDEERAAMRERAQELKAAARRGPRAGKADGESDVLAKIAEMPEPDRAMAERLHAIIKDSAPALSPRTWYGMPAYAKDGKVVCFFQSAQKFKSRYATFGFSDSANLDEGAMWPTSFALTELTAAEEAKIGALVKKALS
jgi:uncharacterized protein YdhG (YjbR/CyaY superfamily)